MVIPALTRNSPNHSTMRLTFHDFNVMSLPYMDLVRDVDLISISQNLANPRDTMSYVCHNLALCDSCYLLPKRA